MSASNAADLRDAGIICTATNRARRRCSKRKILRADVHINAIGAYRPDMCELPAALLRDAAVFVDSNVPVAREAGDLLKAFGTSEAVTRHISRHRGIGGQSGRRASYGTHGLQGGWQCRTGSLCRRRDLEAVGRLNARRRSPP